jgi:hypothetical protein
MSEEAAAQLKTRIEFKCKSIGQFLSALVRERGRGVAFCPEEVDKGHMSF